MITIGQIDSFLRKSGMPATTFGKMVGNDAKLVTDIRAGRQITERMGYRILGFMDAFDAGVKWERGQDEMPKKRMPPNRQTKPVMQVGPESLHHERIHENAIRIATMHLHKALWKHHAGILTVLGAAPL